MSDIHVLPINDIQPHFESRICHCGPKIEGLVIIHNSFDGRELLEMALDYSEAHTS